MNAAVMLGPVTLPQLEAAFEAWENGLRFDASKFRPVKECANLHVSQVAAERAHYFFELLVAQQKQVRA